MASAAGLYCYEERHDLSPACIRHRFDWIVDRYAEPQKVTAFISDHWSHTRQRCHYVFDTQCAALATFHHFGGTPHDYHFFLEVAFFKRTARVFTYTRIRLVHGSCSIHTLNEIWTLVCPCPDLVEHPTPIPFDNDVAPTWCLSKYGRMSIDPDEEGACVEPFSVRLGHEYAVGMPRCCKPYWTEMLDSLDAY
jgi:hypothetical protein